MPISEWIANVRAIIGTDLIVNVGAAAIVVNDKNEILLQQRADNGLWGIPGGGIEPSEEPAQAAVREVYEETGLEVEAVKLVGVFGGEQQQVEFANGDTLVYVSITFECHVIGGEIKPDPDETKDVCWVAIDDLPENFVPVHHRRIAAYVRGEMPYFVVPETFRERENSYVEDIRKRIGNTLIMMPGCDVLVFNEAGQLLVQKRGDDGQWNLPGGIYEPSEEPAETAMREVYEETGLLVRPTRLVGVYGGEDFIHSYPNGDKIAFIDIVFVAEIIGGDLKADKQESLDLQFVSPDELPEPFSPIHKMLIDHALTRDEVYFAT